MIRLRAILFPLYIVAASAVCGPSGCSHRTPSATVVLVDPGGSVTERARKDEFAAVAALIPEMQRGDSVTVIPITDNAAADIQVRVLRLQAPGRRKAYDADLRRFRTETRQQLSAVSASLLAHPGRRPDILGALDVARQEFGIIPGTDRRTLIVVSDFLEDDRVYRLETDTALTDAEDAARLASCIGRTRRFTSHAVTIYLGRLESKDFARLDPQRQEAVRAFWAAYFGNSGERTEMRFDGTGMIQKFGN